MKIKMNCIPNANSAVSITTLIMMDVGGLCHVISSAFIPASIAKPNSAMISEAFTPATCAPTITLSSLVVIKRTKLSMSNDNARPFPDKNRIYKLSLVNQHL